MCKLQNTYVFSLKFYKTKTKKGLIVATLENLGILNLQLVLIFILRLVEDMLEQLH